MYRFVSVDNVVSRCEVKNLLKDLNPSKATGPDDISSTDLKLAAKNIARTIAILFNESLQTGDLSDEFKLGHVNTKTRKDKHLTPIKLSWHHTNVHTLKSVGKSCLQSSKHVPK